MVFATMPVIIWLCGFLAGFPHIMCGENFLMFYRDSKTGIQMLVKSPTSLIRVFWIRSEFDFIYMVVPCLMLGLGAEVDWLTVMGRMMFLNILLYFSPTPGGSGIAEGGFVLLFSNSVPAGTVGIFGCCLAVYCGISAIFRGTILFHYGSRQRYSPQVHWGDRDMRAVA